MQKGRPEQEEDDSLWPVLFLTKCPKDGDFNRNQALGALAGLIDEAEAENTSLLGKANDIDGGFEVGDSINPQSRLSGMDDDTGASLIGSPSTPESPQPLLKHPRPNISTAPTRPPSAALLVEPSSFSSELHPVVLPLGRLHEVGPGHDPGPFATGRRQVTPTPATSPAAQRPFGGGRSTSSHRSEHAARRPAPYGERSLGDRSLGEDSGPRKTARAPRATVGQLQVCMALTGLTS